RRPQSFEVVGLAGAPVSPSGASAAPRCTALPPCPPDGVEHVSSALRTRRSSRETPAGSLLSVPRPAPLLSTARVSSMPNTFSGRSALPPRSAQRRSARPRASYPRLPARGRHRYRRWPPRAAPGETRRKPQGLLGFAVELRRGEKRRRRLQDLVRTPQFTILALQLCDPPSVPAGAARRSARVDLGTLDPRPQRLRMNVQLAVDPPDRHHPLPLGLDRVPRHPRRPLTQLIAVLLRCRHAPHPSWNQSLHRTRGASGGGAARHCG